MEDEYLYAMLATLESPIRTKLRTLFNIRGTDHSQTIHIQMNPHTCNVHGRTYRQLYLIPCTQEPGPPIPLPTYNHTKVVIVRRADKIH